VLSSLVARKSARALPIFVVDESSYPAWRRAQTKTLEKWLAASSFEPKGNRVLMLPGARGPKGVLLGRSSSGLWTWAGAAQRVPVGRYWIEHPLEPEEATGAAIGWALRGYRFDRYKGADAEPLPELVWPKGADRAEARRVVEAIGATRDRINTPAADYGPDELAADAAQLGGRYGAEVEVLKGEALTEGFPALAAVGRGSARPPRLVDLRWGDAERPRLTLVGKGVVFDSGGLNLKSSGGMLLMKKDMGGAAAALGLAQLVMDAALPVRLRVLIGAVENLAGPHAYRPGDVLRTRTGKTVEVTNTDAEGRLVLADALAEADRDEPDLLIDLATLTGSARYALGPEVTPFFTPSAELAEQLAHAARTARDPVWRMPLHLGYRRHLDSRVADLRNSASTPYAGAITAALFLREFVDHAQAWAHLDIFGWCDYGRPGRPVGGEATGLRAVWRLLKDRYGGAST
jgi:leucyl aminopeptidase